MSSQFALEERVGWMFPERLKKMALDVEFIDQNVTPIYEKFKDTKIEISVKYIRVNCVNSIVYSDALSPRLKYLVDVIGYVGEERKGDTIGYNEYEESEIDRLREEFVGKINS